MGAASSRTHSLRHESQEVARARDFLARLNARMPEGETAVSDVPAPSSSASTGSQTTDGGVAAPQTPQPANPRSVRGRSSALPTTGWGPVVAQTIPKDGTPTRSASSLSARHALRCIDWHDEQTGEQGTIDGLPSAVAKAFGSHERRYDSVAELQRSLEALTAQVAFDRVVAMASARERSSHDCVQKLVDEGFDRAVATNAVGRATRYAIIDDKRFAEAFIGSKLRTGWGRRRIERTLAEQHGVDVGSFEGYPERYYGDTDTEEDRARALLAKKSVPAKNPVEKLARFLVTRGFDTGRAFRLAKERVAQEAQEATVDE